MRIDRVVFDFFHGLTGGVGIFDGLFVFVAGEIIIVFILIGFVFTLIVTSSWRARIYYSSIGLLSLIISRGIIMPIIRFFFYSPRPFIELGFEPLASHAPTGSFPSGHMAFIFPIALTYWMLTKSRKLGVLVIIGALSIGVARIIIGVHWPLDIIGGIFVGTAGFIGARILLDKHFPTVSKKGAPKHRKKRRSPISLLD